MDKEVTRYTRFVGKSELCARLGISFTTLRAYMNNRYFEELEKLGYHKKMRIISPQVANHLIDKLC